MINFAQGQAAEDAGVHAQFIEQLGGRMSPQDKEHHDRLLEDPVYRSYYLSGRLNAQLGRALVEVTPEQRAVTMRYLDMACAVRKKMYESLGARDRAALNSSSSINGVARENAADAVGSALATPKYPSLKDMLSGNDRAKLIDVLCRPDTKLSIKRIVNGQSVHIQLRLNVSKSPTQNEIERALSRIASDGLQACVGGTDQWKPIGDVPELHGWIPSERTAIILG